MPLSLHQKLGFRPRRTLPPWYKSKVYLLNNTAPTFHHDYAAQRYYNSVDGETSFPFVSTRTTNAMQFDTQGRLVWAPHQLCTRGNDFANWASLGSDGTVVLNGHIAPTGMPSYTMTYTSLAPSSGLTIGGQISVLGSPNQRVRQSFSIYLRKTNHRWVRMLIYSGSNTANQIRAFIDLDNKIFGTLGVHAPPGSGARDVGGLMADVGNGWIRVTIYGYNPFAHGTDAQLLISTATGDGNTTRVGNGASFELSSAVWEMWGPNTPTHWRSDYTTTGSAWYGPRFDYDPATGEALGVLIEESRTNEMAQSFLLNTAISTCSGGFGTEGPAYLGGWPSVRYTCDGTDTQHFHYTSSVTPTSSQVRTVSAIVAYVDARYVQLTVSANYSLNPSNAYVNYDVTLGTITATGSAVTNAFIRPLGRLMYHVGLTFTSSVTPASGAGCIIGVIPSGISSRLATSNLTTSFDVIYVQNCPGTGFNLPIPTFGTSVTKAADNLSSTSIGWLRQSEGTLFVKYVGTPATNLARRIMAISDGTSLNVIQWLRGTVNQGQMATVNAGISDFNPNTVSNTYFSESRLVARYASPTKAISMNGNSIVSNSVPFPTSGYTTYRVGSAPAISNYMQGWIKEIRYYADSSASDTQLQSVTT